MKNLLVVGVAALLLTACAPAPVPRSAESVAPQGSSEPAAPVDAASEEEPKDEASMQASGSSQPSTSADASPAATYEVPADDPENEAARIVVSEDDEESAVTVGPQTLGPDFTVSAQCRGAESITLELYDDDADMGSAEAFLTIDVPCGEVFLQDESLDEHPESVRPMFVGDVAEAEAWATVTNGVG